MEQPRNDPPANTVTFAQSDNLFLTVARRFALRNRCFQIWVRAREFGQALRLAQNWKAVVLLAFVSVIYEANQFVVRNLRKNLIAQISADRIESYYYQGNRDVWLGVKALEERARDRTQEQHK